MKVIGVFDLITIDSKTYLQPANIDKSKYSVKLKVEKRDIVAFYRVLGQLMGAFPRVELTPDNCYLVWFTNSKRERDKLEKKIKQFSL